MAFTSVGLFSSQVMAPTQSRGAGTFTLGPFSIPANVRYGAVAIDVSQQPDLTPNITLTVDTSADGINFTTLGTIGLNLPQSGYSILGGIIVDGNGTPVLNAWTSLKFPPPNLPNRAVRFTLVVDNPATLGASVAIW